MTQAKDLGHAGLVGWRKQVGDRVAGPVSSKTPLGEDDVRAVVGVLFFALSTYYVISTALRMARAARS
jgi:hypothetical protein